MLLIVSENILIPTGLLSRIDYKLKRKLMSTMQRISPE